MYILLNMVIFQLAMFSFAGAYHFGWISPMVNQVQKNHLMLRNIVAVKSLQL